MIVLNKSRKAVERIFSTAFFRAFSSLTRTLRLMGHFINRILDLSTKLSRFSNEFDGFTNDIPASKKHLYFALQKSDDPLATALSLIRLLLHYFYMIGMQARISVCILNTNCVFSCFQIKRHHFTITLTIMINLCYCIPFFIVDS